ADNRKAKELLGWETQVSLDEGLKRTISWIESSPGAFQSDKYYI
ncbi:MAG: NAD-dependent dehydratase, partial [Chloroflexi bacterium]|nr:NAD-dependent dehydratase [Chloroflexota bacterium]